MTLIVILVIIAFILIMMAVKVLREYERGVLFRLGRLVGAKGPGLFFIIPFIDNFVKVDLRVITMDVPAQECITRDNVTVKVNAVLYFRVVNPEAAIVKVEQHIRATSLVAQTTLRSVLGQSELDELLAQREKLNQILQKTIDEQTDPWGIKVTLVEIKDVELPPTMQRAMAAQAEAERERRAKIVHADGESQAAAKLVEAAQMIATQPAALQLRYLQTLTQIATEKTNTIIFPLPMEILRAFASMIQPGNEPKK